MHPDSCDSHGRSAVANRVRSSGRALFIVLSIVLSLYGRTSALAAQAAPIVTVTDLALRMDADDALDSVCVKQSVPFSVIAARRSDRRARLNEVLVSGSVLDPSIGTMSPTAQRTAASSTPSGSAEFIFSGLRVGTTELRFDGALRGDGNGNAADGVRRRVTVIACTDPRSGAQQGGNGGSGNPAVPVGPVGPKSPAPGTTHAALARINVSTRSTWSVGMEIRATIDSATMIADGQGHFAGTATVTWWTSVIGSPSCGAYENAIPRSGAALIGEIDANNQLVVTITFDPRDFSGIATCGPTISTGNVARLDPVRVTVPLAGGMSTQPHGVTARNGIFTGVVTVIVSTDSTERKDTR